MNKLLGGVLVFSAAMVSGMNGASAITVSGGPATVVVGTTVQVTINTAGCSGDIAYASGIGPSFGAGTSTDIVVSASPVRDIVVPLNVATAAQYGLTTVCVNPFDNATRQTFTVTGVAALPNVPPTAVAGATPSGGVAPLAVTFNSTGSADSDGTIVSYAWNFGDGTNGTGAAPSHTYSAAGSYTATLTVTDNSDASATATVVVAVTAAPATTPPASTATTAASTATTAASTATTAAVVTTAARTPTTVRSSDLPATGRTSGALVGIASALVLAGGAALALRRRPIA